MSRTLPSLRVSDTLIRDDGERIDIYRIRRDIEPMSHLMSIDPRTALVLALALKKTAQHIMKRNKDQ